MLPLVITYFGDTTDDLQDKIRGLIERGGTVVSFSIAYGPTPDAAAHLRASPATAWHAMIVYEWPDEIDRDPGVSDDLVVGLHERTAR
jgi:hypothetical protein